MGSATKRHPVLSAGSSMKATHFKDVKQRTFDLG
jgi:hypothetical protein